MAPYGPSLRLGLIAYYTSADRRTRSRDDTAHLTTPFSIRRPRSSRCRCAAFGKRKPNVRYQKGRKMNDLIHRINNNVFLLLPLQSINEREIKNDLMTRSAEPQLLPPRHFFCFSLYRETEWKTAALLLFREFRPSKSFTKILYIYYRSFDHHRGGRLD